VIEYIVRIERRPPSRCKKRTIRRIPAWMER
jgi:hypothetical protein